MAESILKLRVDSQEYDNKLKRASQGLQQYIDGCRKVGGTLEVVEKETLDYVKAIGNMDTTTRSAKGALGEMTKAFTDLSMEYKRMTDQEKAAPIGKAMSESLDQLRDRIQETKADLSDISSKIGGATGGGGLFSGDKFSGMLQVFGGNVMTKLAGVGVGFASELGDMVKQGIELARQGEGIRIAFERLGRGDILQGLRDATHGTVTDLELMKAAVKFNDFKLPLDELGTMLAFAQQKAKDTGQSVDYMVESITNGLGRKSLMILDNLGLSAAEIKDKMKETGDMTKAVGEIIREQMAKAGDYVETAADRATKANVELENAMTRLGDTFQPLTDAANDMWTSIKVSCLDLISSAVQPLIDKLTEAGRLRAQLNNINAGTGTNQTRAGKDLGYLKYEISKYGANDPHITDLYNRQRGRYIQQENQAWRQSQSAHQKYEDLRQKGANQSDLNAYYQRWQTMEAQAKAWGSVLKEYEEGFKKLTSSAKVNVKTDEAEQKTKELGGSTTTPKVNAFDASKIAFTGGEEYKWEQPQIEHQSLFNLIGEDNLRSYLGAPKGEMARDWGKELGKVFAEYVADPDKNKRNKEEEKTPTATETLQGIQTMVGSLQGILSGIETLGIELPKELTDIIGVLQTITGIVGSIQAMQQVGTFLGLFNNGGIARAANGFVGGNTFSGDQIPIMVNSGELILNRAQQGAIASQLSDSGNQRPSSSPYVTGEIIYLGLTNYLKSTGRGEIMTSRFKQ